MLTLTLRVMVNMKLRDMDEGDQQGYHSLNTMHFSCRIAMGYSLLFSMPVVCVKNFVSMPGSVLKLTISILEGLIRLNYALTVTMDYRMQSERGSKRMHSDWAVKSSCLRLSLA